MAAPDYTIIATRVISLLDRGFRDPRICLKALTRDVGCADYEISRCLVATTGRGFREHLRQRRLDEATRLLAEDALSLKEISSQAGFGSASQFTRQFRAAVGITPSTYRRLLRMRRAS